MNQIDSDFCVFATIERQKIQLETQGLDILQEYDNIVVITMEGNFKNGKNRQGHRNQILICRHPQYNYEIKRYIVILELMCINEEAKQLANQFCALASTLIMVVNYQRCDLSYLSIRDNLKNKGAALAGIVEDKRQENLKQEDQEFRNALELQKVKVEQYPEIDSLVIPIIQKQSEWRKVLYHFHTILEGKLGSNQLLHGHIIRSYCQNLAFQQGKYKRMEAIEAENNIETDAEFEEYLQIICKYNNKCKSELNNQANFKIDLLLQKARQDIEQQSLFENNLHYAQKLQKHMNRKEIEMRHLNQQFIESSTLNYLNRQSNKLLRTVKNRQDNTREKVNEDLKKFIADCNQGCEGKNKQKILSDFLQVFTPTLYSEAKLDENLNKKLKSAKKNNEELERQIEKLRKKNEKCCEIM